MVIQFYRINKSSAIENSSNQQGLSKNSRDLDIYQSLLSNTKALWIHTHRDCHQNFLTHFTFYFLFYIPWKNLRASSFLTALEGIEMEHQKEMNQWKKNLYKIFSIQLGSHALWRVFVKSVHNSSLESSILVTLPTPWYWFFQ